MRQNQDINDLIVQMVVCKSVIQKQQNNFVSAT